ncbi:MAG TPA: hypothetical protein VF789_22590 [Thermoanaerobaculia bacterium]
MASPPVSLPQSLIIDSWNPYKSGIPEKLFRRGDIIKIDSQELGIYRLSWRKAVYSVLLSWQGGKLQGTVPIKNQLNRSVVDSLVTVQISKDQADNNWTGKLTLAGPGNGSEGNTGVFVAQADGKPDAAE